MERRLLRVRTIQASLQIEANSLVEEQVTAILDVRRVSAPHNRRFEKCGTRSSAT
jgi:hypothetical protein